MDSTDDFENFFAQAARQAQAGPPRPVLYLFQFVALPEEAFQNHPELIRELENGPVALMTLLHARSMATIRCAQAGGMPSPHMITEEDVQAQNQLFRTLSVQAHKSNGYTAHVVTMPAPQSPPEAYFAAIVFKDDEPKVYRQASPSTRYFTLEMSLGGMTILGESLRGGARRNFGPVPAPDPKTFVQAVFEQMARAGNAI